MITQDAGEGRCIEETIANGGGLGVRGGGKERRCGGDGRTGIVGDERM